MGAVHPLNAYGKVDYSSTVPCKCRSAQYKKEQNERYLKFCRLPDASDGLTLEAFQTLGNATLELAKRYAERLADGSENVKWLTLIGVAGCGKTHLAVGICRRWITASKVARYSFVPLLLKELRDGYELMGEASYRSRFDALCQVPLLILDDLGVEKSTEWAQEQLQTLIHYRGFYGLPLVVTTNHPLNRLNGDNEERIASRLKRELWCKVVTITAPEYKK